MAQVATSSLRALHASSKHFKEGEGSPHTLRNKLRVHISAAYAHKALGEEAEAQDAMAEALKLAPAVGEVCEQECQQLMDTFDKAAHSRSVSPRKPGGCALG